MSVVTSIDAEIFRNAFLSGAANLSNKKEIINELNVFPVPDGDTGTNMTLTIMSAAEEVRGLINPTIDDMGKAIASGSLRGARGNSGVILSQLFRGFCKDIKGKKALSTEDLASAFSRAVETAYKAVMKPKEGTILTVAKGISEKAFEIYETTDDITEFLSQVVEYGDEVLSKTPDLLPVLKEAGVVDSGGQGLMEVMRGILLSLLGEDVKAETPEAETVSHPKIDIADMRGSSREDISTADIKYTYCTEFICNLNKPLSDEEVEAFKAYLLTIGDSLVCVNDDEIVKVHVHTNHPGEAFEKALTFGFLTNMKIDNMKEEHSERVLLEMERIKNGSFSLEYKKEDTVEEKASVEKDVAAEPEKDFGFIAVSSGDGLTEVFKGVAVDHVISGGQTMNPSTEDFLNAVKEVNAKTIFLLPNNKNIILAANQAANLSKDKKLLVVPTVSIPQGISAMLSFSLDMDAETNLKNMKEAAQNVKSGEVTFSIRDTSIDGKTIAKDDIMGISDKGIEAVGSDVSEVTKELIRDMTDEDTELVTVYYGADVEDAAAEKLTEELGEEFPDIEFELQNGGQPIYYYLVSVE